MKLETFETSLMRIDTTGTFLVLTPETAKTGDEAATENVVCPASSLNEPWLDLLMAYPHVVRNLAAACRRIEWIKTQVYEAEAEGVEYDVHSAIDVVETGLLLALALATDGLKATAGSIPQVKGMSS